MRKERNLQFPRNVLNSLCARAHFTDSRIIETHFAPPLSSGAGSINYDYSDDGVSPSEMSIAIVRRRVCLCIRRPVTKAQRPRTFRAPYITYPLPGPADPSLIQLETHGVIAFDRRPGICSEMPRAEPEQKSSNRSACTYVHAYTLACARAHVHIFMRVVAIRNTRACANQISRFSVPSRVKMSSICDHVIYHPCDTIPSRTNVVDSISIRPISHRA